MLDLAVFLRLSRYPQATAAGLSGKRWRGAEFNHGFAEKFVSLRGLAGIWSKNWNCFRATFSPNRGLPFPIIPLPENGDRFARDAEYRLRTQNEGERAEDGILTPWASRTLGSCAPESRLRTNPAGNGEKCGWGPDSHRTWGYCG